MRDVSLWNLSCVIRIDQTATWLSAASAFLLSRAADALLKFQDFQERKMQQKLQVLILRYNKYQIQPNL